MASINWTPITTAQGTTGYNAPDPNNPGLTLYKGPDGVIYADPYSGEVHAGDLANKVSPAQQQQFNAASAPAGTTKNSINPIKGTPTTGGAKTATPSNPAGGSASGGTAQIGQFIPTAAQINSYAPQEASVAYANPTNTTAATYQAAQSKAAQQASTQNAVGQGYTAATVNPNSSQQGLQQYEQTVAASLAPQFQQQQAAAQAQQAANGIFLSGDTTYNQTNLDAQQNATLAAQDAQGQLAAQSDYYNVLSGNQNAENTASQFGASAANTASLANASAYDSAAQQYASNVENTNLANQNATNTAGQYNATNQQSANQYNATAANNASALNTAAYNTAANNYANQYNNYYTGVEGQAYNTSNEALEAYLSAFGNPQSASMYSAAGNAASNAYNSGVQSQTQANGALGSTLGSIAGAVW